MNVKMTDKNIFMVVAAVGFLILVLMYFLMFKSYREQAQSLEANNAQLRTQVADMKQYYDQMGDYREESKKIVQAIHDMVEEYPADAREEDIVMMAVDMEKVSAMAYSTINVKESEVLYSIPAEEVLTAGQEDLTKEIGFVEKQCTYSGTVGYGGLKNCIQEIYSNPNRIGINNIAFVREEVQIGDYIIPVLTGDIDVAFYSMTGIDKQYVAPKMPSYVEGAMNPFQMDIYMIPSED